MKVCVRGQFIWLWYEMKNIVFEIQRIRCRWFGQTINECMWFGSESRSTMATSSFNDRCAVRAQTRRYFLNMNLLHIWNMDHSLWEMMMVMIGGDWWVGIFYHAQRKNHFKNRNDSVFWFIYVKIISGCEAHIQW